MPTRLPRRTLLAAALPIASHLALPGSASARPRDDAEPSPAPAARLLAPLPVAASSLGAIAAGGFLYAYGGHVAPVHTYSTAAVSGAFRRLPLGRDGAAWEDLPGGTPMQGMNLATDGRRVFRAGGMVPRNAPDTPADNVSSAEAVLFDPAAPGWRRLPDLPVPRSSHDAVIVDGTLWIVGGWNMRGDDGEEWFDSAAALDLAAAEPAWRTLPQPFTRRALTAAAHRGKVWVLGGFTDSDEMSLSVDVLDPLTGVWSHGPDLPGPEGNGFAPAACSLGDRLLASVADGRLLELDEPAGAWREIAALAPRIVHRLVADGDGVILVGGAAGKDNLDRVERVAVGRG